MLKRIIILLFVSLFFFISSKAQIFFEDFNNGIPSTFKIYDEDKLIPNQSMTGLGFSVGIGWIAYDRKDEQKAFAISTSAYTSEGTSKDWLITPEIQIPSSGFFLEWKAISCSQISKSGYKVLISTTGCETKDFQEEPIFEVIQEESQWVCHYVSLEKYAGKSVFIAFVNNSSNKFLLGIDDITIQIPQIIGALKSASPLFVSGVVDFAVSGKLCANYAYPIHTFTASYSYKDETVTQVFNSQEINPNEEYTFIFEQKLSTLLGDTIHYSITVDVNGEKQTIQNNTICYAFTPKRIHVIEEGTGTWCGNCPAGHFAMDYMRKTYGDDYIGIAVHNGDPMTVSSYDNGLYSMNIGGYPIGFINRKYKSSPLGTNLTPADGGFETWYLKALEEIAPMDLEFHVDYTTEEQNEIRLYGNACLALNMDYAKYNIAFVVKECNVKGTSVQYNQANYYSGYDKLVGGYEKLPRTIPASMMVYHEVARTIKPYFKGEVFIDGSVKANDKIEFDYLLPMPASVKNKGSLSFVVLLLNSVSGEIVNAREFKFEEHEHEEFGSETFIQVQNSDTIFDMTISKTDCAYYVFVNTNTSTTINAELYDINGILLSSQFGRYQEDGQIFKFVSKSLSGVYMIRFRVNGIQYVRKIVF